MPGYLIDIEKKTLQNEYFREALYTTQMPKKLLVTETQFDEVNAI